MLLRTIKHFFKISKLNSHAEQNESPRSENVDIVDHNPEKRNDYLYFVGKSVDEILITFPTAKTTDMSNTNKKDKRIEYRHNNETTTFVIHDKMCVDVYVFDD